MNLSDYDTSELEEITCEKRKVLLSAIRKEMQAKCNSIQLCLEREDEYRSGITVKAPEPRVLCKTEYVMIEAVVQDNDVIDDLFAICSDLQIANAAMELIYCSSEILGSRASTTVKGWQDVVFKNIKSAYSKMQKVIKGIEKIEMKLMHNTL